MVLGSLTFLFRVYSYMDFSFSRVNSSAAYLSINSIYKFKRTLVNFHKT